MPDNNKPPLHEQINEQLHEAGEQIEQELKWVIQFIDEKVVPEVREKSSIALRDASQRLAKLAEHIDSLKSKPQG